MSAINLARFVDEALDREEFPSQDAAIASVVNQIATVAPRSLTHQERVLVEMEVAMAWNRHSLSREAFV